MASVADAAPPGAEAPGTPPPAAPPAAQTIRDNIDDQIGQALARVHQAKLTMTRERKLIKSLRKRKQRMLVASRGLSSRDLIDMIASRA